MARLRSADLDRDDSAACDSRCSASASACSCCSSPPRKATCHCLGVLPGQRAPLRRSRRPARAAHGLEPARVQRSRSPLLDGVAAGDYVYFVHSYAAPRRATDGRDHRLRRAASPRSCAAATSAARSSIPSVPRVSARASLLRNFLKAGMKTTMELIPAIDLRDGRCVRLLKGDFDAETRLRPTSRTSCCERYRALGARWLHVVDLDGATDGSSPIAASSCGSLADARLQHPGRRRRALARAWSTSCCACGHRPRRRRQRRRRRRPIEVHGWLHEFGAETIVPGVRRAPGRSRHAHASRRTAGARRATSRSGTAIERYLPHGLTHVLCTDVERDGALPGPNCRRCTRKRVRRYPGIALAGLGRRRSARDLRALARLRRRRRDQRQGAAGRTRSLPRSCGHSCQTHHPLPRRPRRPGRQGRALPRPRDRGRHPRARRRAIATKARTSSCSTTSPRAPKAARSIAAGCGASPRILDIPFCVAGGIRCVADAEAVLNAGAEKISINSPRSPIPS